MPELPEVETIVRGLRRMVKGLGFSGLEVRLNKCLRGSERALVQVIRGKKILAIDRRGKNIIFRLSGGMALVIHLGMTGRLRVVPKHFPLEKHTHIIFFFQNHPRQLRFVDSRQFGRLFWEKRVEGDLRSLSRLGPEPMEISPMEFFHRVRSRTREIKSLLLDQQFMAGVGNIYADESLHRAGIHPRRKSSSLGEKILFNLLRSLQEALRESIEAGGTSVRSYVDSSGAKGAFQNFLRVYGREGAPCLVCGTSIVREPVGGRSSFYCPRCQSLSKKDGGRRKSPSKNPSRKGKTVA